MGEMLKVEFHCHTQYSKDCLVSPRQLVDCCRRKGIDRVIITDHNTTAGALVAHDLDPQRVIIGEEIMTTRGEILAAFLKTEIPPGLSPQETIERLRDQGAFVSVAHPFDSARRGAWNPDALLEIVPLIDAVEVFNSRCMRRRANHMAAAFAARLGLAGTVGSDAHTCWELGRATLLLPPFTNAAELRSLLPQGISDARWSPPWIHLTSRYAVWRKRFTRRLDMPTGA